MENMEFGLSLSLSLSLSVSVKAHSSLNNFKLWKDLGESIALYASCFFVIFLYRIMKVLPLKFLDGVLVNVFLDKFTVHTQKTDMGLFQKGIWLFVH